MTELHHALKTSADYQALPAKVSQLVLKQVEKTFKSYQKAQEQFKKSPSKCTGEPKKKFFGGGRSQESGVRSQEFQALLPLFFVPSDVL